MTRRVREKEEKDTHWLNDGISGQQALLSELDPYIYRADQSILQILRSFQIDRARGQDRAQVLLYPPHDAIGYQLGALSEMFTVYVKAPDHEEFREEVAFRYHVEILAGGVPYELEGRLDYIVYTQYSWASLDDFRRGVRAAAGLLEPYGRVVFLLPGVLAANGTNICWDDGSETEVGKFERGEVFLLAPPRAAEILPFADIEQHEDEYLRRFLKRHRNYFGKAALGPTLERMRDPDFTATLLGEGSRTRCSVVMTWDSLGVEVEKGA